MIGLASARAYASGMTIQFMTQSGSPTKTIAVPASNSDLTQLLKQNRIKGFGVWVGTTAVVVVDSANTAPGGIKVERFSLVTSAGTEAVPFEYSWDYDVMAVFARAVS